MESSINDIYVQLQELAKNRDDIFLLSFKNKKVDAFQIYNKGDGKEGITIEQFGKLKNIIFIDTVNRKKTNLLEYMKNNKFNPVNEDGELIIAYDGRTKTMNMLAVHNTNLGPALGGLREKDYDNFDSMLTDTLRLAKGMTYKAAVAKTGTGGGKSTRTVQNGRRKEANLSTARIFNFINEKRKKRNRNVYVVAEDSNICCTDLDQIYEIDPDTTCKSLHLGGTGNPSPVTAIGVYHAAKAGAEYAFADKTLKNKTVLLSGIGQVGYELLKNFIFNGVKEVICAEISKDRIDWVKKQFERMQRKAQVKFMGYSKEELRNQKFLHDLGTWKILNYRL